MSCTALGYMFIPQILEMRSGVSTTVLLVRDGISWSSEPHYFLPGLYFLNQMFLIPISPHLFCIYLKFSNSYCNQVFLPQNSLGA